MKVMLPIVTKDAMRIFEAFFKGVSTRSGLRKIEMSIDKSAFHILYCMTHTDEDRIYFITLKITGTCRALSRARTRWTKGAIATL